MVEPGGKLGSSLVVYMRALVDINTGLRVERELFRTTQYGWGVGIQHPEQLRIKWQHHEIALAAQNKITNTDLWGTSRRLAPLLMLF